MEKTVAENDNSDSGHSEGLGRPAAAGNSQANDEPRNVRASDSLLGLCANCEKREFCNYPRPEGGVWRCEGYA